MSALPYFQLRPLWLHHIFPHYLIRGAIFGKKLLNTKCVFWFSLQLLFETFLILRIIQRDIVINVNTSLCEHEREGCGTVCGFCHVKYCYITSEKEKKNWVTGYNSKEKQKSKGFFRWESFRAQWKKTCIYRSCTSNKWSKIKTAYDVCHCASLCSMCL
jgi:hypothetical protein